MQTMLSLSWRSKILVVTCATYRFLLAGNQRGARDVLVYIRFLARHDLAFQSSARLACRCILCLSSICSTWHILLDWRELSLFEVGNIKFVRLEKGKLTNFKPTFTLKKCKINKQLDLRFCQPSKCSTTNLSIFSNKILTCTPTVFSVSNMNVLCSIVIYVCITIVQIVSKLGKSGESPIIFDRKTE